jgi:putative holliday junction resolvase
MSGRILGIDHGIKRIGLAISDERRMIARELRIIQRKTRLEDFTTLNGILQQEKIVACVVGVPYSDAPDGVHTQADTVRLWISRFQETITLPIIEWDESLTSDEAREIAKRQRRKPTDPIDDLAARVILQSYLDALSEGLATPPEDT